MFCLGSEVEKRIRILEKALHTTAVTLDKCVIFLPKLCNLMRNQETCPIQRTFDKITILCLSKLKVIEGKENHMCHSGGH